MPADLTDPGLDSDAARLGGILAGFADESLAGPPVDWPPLIRRALDERVGPLLHSKLAGDPRIPERERSLLRAELYRAEASSLVLYRELGRLLQRSAESGLEPPVLLKGGALAASVYDEVGHRPMGDIDVLVRRGRARPLARNRGRLFRLSRDERGGDRDSPRGSRRRKESEATIELRYGLIAESQLGLRSTLVPRADRE
jgi:hypothetical protein